MTESTDTGLGLLRLSDSEFILEDQAQDIRGLDVYDKGGEEINTVEGLYVDTEERKVRFLDVGAGGFLGLGEKNFLIPVEAVREVNEEGVVVDQSREKVVDSPPFDTDVVPQAPYQRDIYDYYGYARSAGVRVREPGPGASRIFPQSSGSLHSLNLRERGAKEV